MREFIYEDVKLEVHDKVFFPTETSKLFIEYFRANNEKYSSKSKDILDLGCGCGIVSIVMKQKGYENTFYASDISPEAVANTLQNAQKNKIEINAKSGSVFTPWENKKFDIIMDDISGVAEEIAKVSEWFGEEISCESGKDGIKLTKMVLNEAKDYLKKDGELFFPVLTLSDSKKLLEYASTLYTDIKEVSRKSFYLPQEFSSKYKSLIEDQINKKHIHIEEKFGMYIWETIIYRAKI